MSTSNSTAALPSAARGPRPEPPRPQYLELKANVHRKLLNRLNLEALANAERSRAEAEIRTLLFDLIAEESTPLSMSEREVILGDVVDEVFGLGPLEPLLRDPSVSDILVNTYKSVYVERGGKLEKHPTTFQDDRHLLRVIDRIVSGVGRRVDDSSPMVDARLPDGSRVNAIIPPLAVDGPLLSIRRFPGRTAEGRGPRYPAFDDEADARVPRALRQVEAEHADQRRHRRRQDDAAERALELHLGARPHRHDRGRGGTAAAPGARRPPRDASAERRRARGRSGSVSC